MSLQCRAFTKQEKKCKGKNIVDDANQLCIYHSQLPEHIEYRKNLAIQGGKAVNKTVMDMKYFRIQTPQDQYDFMRNIMQKIARGSYDLKPFIKHLPNYSKELRELYNLVEMKRELDELKALQKKKQAQ